MFTQKDRQSGWIRLLWTYHNGMIRRFATGFASTRGRRRTCKAMPPAGTFASYRFFRLELFDKTPRGPAIVAAAVPWAEAADPPKTQQARTVLDVG